VLVPVNVRVPAVVLVRPLPPARMAPAVPLRPSMTAGLISTPVVPPTGPPVRISWAPLPPLAPRGKVPASPWRAELSLTRFEPGRLNVPPVRSMVPAPAFRLVTDTVPPVCKNWLPLPVAVLVVRPPLAATTRLLPEAPTPPAPALTLTAAP